MFTGTCTIRLSIPYAQSLKDKRSVVKSIVARVRNQFNVSIAEVGENDSWQSAVIGVACVSNSKARVHSLLVGVVDFIERSRFDAVLLDYEIDIF